MSYIILLFSSTLRLNLKLESLSTSVMVIVFVCNGGATVAKVIALPKTKACIIIVETNTLRIAFIEISFRDLWDLLLNA